LKRLFLAGKNALKPQLSAPLKRRAENGWSEQLQITPAFARHLSSGGLWSSELEPR